MSVEVRPGSESVSIPLGEVELAGDLEIPPHLRGLVLFAHGSGSSRFSPRNRYVAGVLRDAGFATLLFDLLSAEEERVDMVTGELRFDIELLAERLVGATDRMLEDARFREVELGYFGASTGAAAALIGAAMRGERIGAVVSRGGRPDLAGPALGRVRAPTLLIVGSRDQEVIRLNEAARERMSAAEVELTLVPGATHLFEEPGTLEQAADLARRWFLEHLGAADQPGDSH